MKHFVLTPNPYRDKGFRCALYAERVLRKAGAETKICLPFDVDRNFDLPSGVKLHDLEASLKTCDAMICFGGDGTILHASKQAIRHNVPILGVNVGTMGFIAELEASELDLLRRLVTDEFKLDQRKMLHTEVHRGNDVLYTDTALNDAVVTKGAVARVLQMSVQVDGVEACKLSGDGVIVATPTGSTAYSMSAGGPIVEPSADNMIVTPICAHALQTKSIVLPGNRTVTMQIGSIGRKSAYLSVDGGRAFRLNAGDHIVVTMSDKHTDLIRIKNTSFYQIINKKFRDK
jgi:NAD+ kinase